MFDVTFVTWLDTKLARKGWTRSELARRGNFSHSALSHIYNGKRGVGYDLCVAIAHALEEDEEIVLRAAGLLEPKLGTDEDYEELKHLFNQMTEEEQEEFLAQGRLKIDLRKKRGDQHELPQARPARA